MATLTNVFTTSSSINDNIFLQEFDVTNKIITETLTIQQFRNQVFAFASKIRNSSSHSENRLLAVIMFPQNSISVLVAVAAMWILNIPPFLVSWSLDDETISQMIEKELEKVSSCSELIFVDLSHNYNNNKNTIKRSEKIIKIIKSTTKRRSFENISVFAKNDFKSLQESSQSNNNNIDIQINSTNESNENSIAAILHTSGTTTTTTETSIPSRFHLSHKNLISNQKEINCFCHNDNEENSFSSLLVLPLFHGFGFETQFLRHLYLLLMKNENAQQQQENNNNNRNCMTILTRSKMNNNNDSDSEVTSSSSSSFSFFSASEIYSALETLKDINSLFLVPTIFDDLMNIMSSSSSSSTSSKKNKRQITIFVGGGKVNSVSAFLNNNNNNQQTLFDYDEINIRSLLGMTEIGGTLMMLTSSSQKEEDVNWMRFPSKSFEKKYCRFVFLDENNNNNHHNNNVAELLISSDCPCLSSDVELDVKYESDETSQQETKKWFRTKDLYLVRRNVSNIDKNNDEKNDDDSALLQHIGRTDFLFKLSTGKTINPILIESIFEEIYCCSSNNDNNNRTSCVVVGENKPFYVVVFEEKNASNLVEEIQKKKEEDDDKTFQKLQQELSHLGKHCMIQDFEQQIFVLPSSCSSSSSSNENCSCNNFFFRSSKGTIQRQKTIDEIILPFLKEKLTLLFAGDNNHVCNNDDEKDQDLSFNISAIKNAIRESLEKFQQEEGETQNLICHFCDSIAVSFLLSSIVSKLGNKTLHHPTTIELLVLFQTLFQQQQQQQNNNSSASAAAAASSNNNNNNNSQQNNFCSIFDNLVDEISKLWIIHCRRVSDKNVKNTEETIDIVKINSEFQLPFEESFDFVKSKLLPQISPSTNSTNDLFEKDRKVLEEGLEFLQEKNKKKNSQQQQQNKSWNHFITLLATCFIIKIPFQSITNVIVPFSERKIPSWEEIKKDMFDDKKKPVGGQCFSMNVFFGALLKGLFSVFHDDGDEKNNTSKNSYFGRCSIHGVENCHVAVFLRNSEDFLLFDDDDDDKNDDSAVYQIEVASGYLFPILMKLPTSTKSKSESFYYRFGNLLLKYEKKRCDSSSCSSSSSNDEEKTFYNLWHLWIPKNEQEKTENEEKNDLQSLWETLTSSKQEEKERSLTKNNVPSLFWTTDACEQPVFSSASSSSSRTQQEESYLNYNKFRASRGKIVFPDIEEEQEKILLKTTTTKTSFLLQAVRMIYLKADLEFLCEKQEKLQKRNNNVFRLKNMTILLDDGDLVRIVDSEKIKFELKNSFEELIEFENCFV